MKRDLEALAGDGVRRAGHRRRGVRRRRRLGCVLARLAGRLDRTEGFRERRLGRMLQDGSRRHPLSAARRYSPAALLLRRALRDAAHRSASGHSAADPDSDLRPRPSRARRSWRPACTSTICSRPAEMRASPMTRAASRARSSCRAHQTLELFPELEQRGLDRRGGIRGRTDVQHGAPGARFRQIRREPRSVAPPITPRPRDFSGTRAEYAARACAIGSAARSSISAPSWC